MEYYYQLIDINFPQDEQFNRNQAIHVFIFFILDSVNIYLLVDYLVIEFAGIENYLSNLMRSKIKYNSLPKKPSFNVKELESENQELQARLIEKIEVARMQLKLISNLSGPSHS